MTAALGIKVTLNNPYRHKTKGEMACECRDKAFLKAKLKDTMSCSSPTKGRWKKLPNGHCGYCVPCLIRRAAIIAAFGKDDTYYAMSKLPTGDGDPRRADQRNLRSFTLAVRRLKSNPSLAKLMIHSSGPLSEFSGEWKAYAQMYMNGMQEVAHLLNLRDDDK